MPRVLTVRSTRVHNGVWLVAFAEIPDRTGAESLRGTRLVVDAGDVLPVVDEDDVFTEEQLRGLEAGRPRAESYSATDGGLELGAAQDRLVILLPDGREAQVPFVAALVPEVDLEGGRVVVDAPPGLLDLGV